MKTWKPGDRIFSSEEIKQQVRREHAAKQVGNHAVMVKATLGWLYGPTPNVQNAIDILEVLLKDLQ